MNQLSSRKLYQPKFLSISMGECIADCCELICGYCENSPRHSIVVSTFICCNHRQKVYTRFIIKWSVKQETLVMIKSKIFITQNVQDGPSRHVMASGKDWRDDATIPCNVPKNLILSCKCTYIAGKFHFRIRYLLLNHFK